MILTKVQLKQCLAEEKKLYFPNGKLRIDILTSENNLKIYKFVRLLRLTEYHHNNAKTVYHKLMYLRYRRKKNILGRKLGIEIWDNTFDKGLLIYHSGNIVINGNARIGENCKLHGNNCIGNNGITSDSPKIGNNVRLGVGAKVIGNVEIADDITIAAGAVVVHSWLTPGVVLAGVPAKIVKVS